MMLTVGILLLAFGILLVAYPRVLAYPLAAVIVWFALSLLYRSIRLRWSGLRKDDHSAS